MGISRKRLTSLELGSFDEVSNSELIAVCAFYTRVLEKFVNVGDLLRYDPNNKRAFIQELALQP